MSNLINLTLPIYYTQEYKTKNDKTFLVGMNWMRNAYFHQQNQVKQHYHKLIKQQLDGIDLVPIADKFTMQINIYYKNINSDPSNISSLMEKFTLDALQELNLIVNDNSKYHYSTSWFSIEQDKLNPRVEITISPKE